MNNTSPLNTAASLLVGLAVLLSGAHAKDVAATLPSFLVHVKKDDLSQVVKISHDPHHHSDHSIKIQAAGGDGHQSDTRSLRLLNHRKQNGHASRLSDRLRLWWQLSSVNLS